MSDRQRQQRAAMIVGGAAAGGLAIIGLAVALASGGGGDDTNAIDTSRTTTSSSSTTSSSTSTSTSTTTTTIVIPTAPPPTTIVIPTAPPTVPPTSPPTSPPTTSPPTTDPPTTTTTLPPNKQLALQLDTALNGGVPPDPGQERVTVGKLGSNKAVVVTWKLDASLPPEVQADQAREEALLLLTTVQSANPPGNDKMRFFATIPDPDGTGTDVVIKLVIDRSQFDAFDFSSFNPDDEDVFDLPFITSKDIDESVVPNPYPPSSTTSTSEEPTTTTEETTPTT